MNEKPAPQKPEVKHTKEHREYLDGLKNKTLVEKYYNIMLRKANNFNEDIYKQYHKVYVKISNKKADFLVNMTTFMNSNKTPDEKWEGYKKLINDAIEDWDREFSSNPEKQIGVIK